MPQRVIRASVLDVTPQRPLSFAAEVTGRAVDTVETGAGGDGKVLRTAEIRLTLDEDLRIAAFASSAGDLGLVGCSAGRGFRAALEPLRAAGVEQRLLARLLWDVPMFAQVAGQTALLDHDRARADLTLSRRGTDQCSGWQADGQMMQQVDGNGGVLVMPLGPERTSPSIAAQWLPVDPPSPMATRRSRVLRVGTRLPSGGYPVQIGFRDSYADPDGTHRALHEWDVQTEYGSDGRFGALTVDAGRLPWVECPVAGLSAGRLDGATPAEVDAALGSGFGGISTCTHLNDTLRSLVDITDLAIEPAQA